MLSSKLIIVLGRALFSFVGVGLFEDLLALEECVKFDAVKTNLQFFITKVFH